MKPGDRVVAPFVFSDGICEFCRKGLRTLCVRGNAWGALRADGGQGEAARVSLDASAVLTMRVALDGVPDGYRAMDSRTAVKVLVDLAA